MVKSFPAKVFMLYLYCDKCKHPMEKTGEVYPTYPSKYKYRCPKCGYTETIRGNYPSVSYEVDKNE